MGVVYVDKVVGSKKFTRRDLMVLSAIASQAGMAIYRAQLARQLETLFSDTIRTLVNIVEVKDEYTYGHSERVTSVAVRLGERMELDLQALRDLRLVGLLHDVGKIGIPQDILTKPGKLTNEEFERIKSHPEMGARIIGTIANADTIARAILYHHERWDGTGYPAGLSGEEIPLLSRVIAIADAFDSMAAGRPYRSVEDKDFIEKEYTNGAGTQFDPSLAEHFVRAMSTDEAFLKRIGRAYKLKSESEEEQVQSVV